MKKVLTAILFLFLISLCCETFAAPKYFSDGKKNVAPNPIFNKTILVPAGQILSINIINEVNSETAKTVDRVDAVLSNDFVYNGKLIALEGSSIVGMVTKVSAPEKDKPAELMIKFTGIITPNNQTIPISAIFNTPDRTGITYGSGTGNAVVNANSTADIIIKQPVTFIPLN